jgi:hypothetical protein
LPHADCASGIARITAKLAHATDTFEPGCEGKRQLAEPLALVYVEVIDAGGLHIDEKLSGSRDGWLGSGLDRQLLRSAELMDDDALHN